jgi:septal ring factor EnvC (AmiA/AmiB activator)
MPATDPNPADARSNAALTAENHRLRANLVDAERDLERREKVIAKLALRVQALEEQLDAQAESLCAVLAIREVGAKHKPDGNGGES